MKNVIIIFIANILFFGCVNTNLKNNDSSKDSISIIDSVLVQKTISPVKLVETIIFDLTQDGTNDTIELFQYISEKYEDSEFQSIGINYSKGSRFYSNLYEPYDYFDSIQNKKFNLIKSKRIIVTKIDSDYYVLISSKAKNGKLGLLDIIGVYKDNLYISLTRRLQLDSIVKIDEKYYENVLFAKEQNDSTLEIKNVIYSIPKAEFEEEMRFSQDLTNKYFNKNE
jgi:hypothetical protein